MKILRSEKSKIKLFAPILLLILTACSPGRFDTGPSTSLVLPPVISYEPKFLQSVAVEAQGNACTSHVELGKDYKLTRDKLRIVHQKFKR